MPTSAIRSTIDVRQFTLREKVFALASSMASTSTTVIVAAGVGVGVGAAAVEELPDDVPVNDGEPDAGVAFRSPKMLSLILSKMPIECLAVSGEPRQCCECGARRSRCVLGNGLIVRLGSVGDVPKTDPRFTLLPFVPAA